MKRRLHGYGFRRMVFGLVLLGISAGAPGAHAFEAVSFGAGFNEDGIAIYRVEVQKGLGYRWYESSTGFLLLSLDGSVDYWHKADDGNVAAALSPFLTYYFKTDRPILPFIEGGIGAAYVSDTRIEGRDLGIHFQFQDILGVGVRLWRNHGIRVRALHYSNAGIDDANDGITFYTVSYHYRF